MAKNSVVIFDRDGTLNARIRGGYLLNAKEIQRPNDLEVLKLLIYPRFRIAIASNQACISKGLIDISGVRALTKAVLGPILSLDDSQIFICGHQERDNCLCRKPKSKLLDDCLHFYSADPEKSFFIGDSQSDKEAATNAGVNFMGVCWDGECLGFGCSHTLSEAIRLIVGTHDVREGR